MPTGFTRVWYRDSQYYYADGYWYRPQGRAMVVTLPPTGVRVSVLPAFAETLWMGGTTYYFAAGSYYRTDPGAASSRRRSQRGGRADYDGSAGRNGLRRL